MDYTDEEKIIKEAIIDARKVQDYIWGKLNMLFHPFNPQLTANVFYKRVCKIADLDPKNPNYKTELRKRVLQQAALSILILRILDQDESI